MASDAVSRFFSTFGSVTGVDVPDPNKAQCLVTFAALEPAAAAQAATNKRACDALGGRTLWVEFARDPEEVRRDDAAAAEVAHLDPQHKQQELWCPRCATPPTSACPEPHWCAISSPLRRSARS